MGRFAALILALAMTLLLVGCGEEAKSKADAQKELLAPTDVNSLSPEMRAKVEAIQRGNATATQKAGS
ncbi:MAG: hypothetical protein H7Y17_10990 [Chlorobia bacterium]|nr:hypothetical protein [Fimbriimonadaceae bacterium]